MSTPGITVPKLLPITGTFAPFFATYYSYLLVRVSLIRQNSDTYLGDSSKSDATDKTTDPLFTAGRAQLNFAENVPLALLLGAVVEMNGGNRKALTAGFAALFIARILHVELGLKGEKALGVGRPIGHMTTVGFIFGMAGYAAYLVKGYWGL